MVVGLGNPGPNYALNRHNVGQIFLDLVAQKLGETFKSHKSNSMVAEAKIIGGPKLILAKPLSFMNLSGGPTASLLKFYKLDPADLLVVHDELDIPLATFKLKQGGGHGGHNGLRDIISALGTTEFARMRIGIGRPPEPIAAADYVLKNFSPSEQKALVETFEVAFEALVELAQNGILSAQTKFHSSSD